MAGKKQRPYEYERELKRQWPKTQKQIRDEEERARKRAEKKAREKKKTSALLRKTKKRLKKVFGG